jgi:endonuclease G
MGTPQEQLMRLRRFNASVREGDPKLAEESADLGVRTEALEVAMPAGALEDAITLESIAMRRERPVLAIKENETKLVFIDQADSEIWGERLKKAKPLLDKAIRAVGRVDLKGGPLDWVGTGWLVSENVIVTNRHVAREFATRKGEGFTFQMGTNGQISADVDFLQEIDNPNKLVFKLTRPLHIEDAPGPDVAFFEIEIMSGNSKLATPIELATQIAQTENIATIGYPAYDSRIPEPDLMERIFGKTYNKKRLAPGGVTRVEQTRIWHNCTTLGGNSGSVIFDLDNGNAVGLHFSGSFLATNYAVRSDVVKKLLADVRGGRVARRSGQPAREVRPPLVTQGRPAIVRRGGSGTATLTIPLTISVSLGDVRGSTPVPGPLRMPPMSGSEEADIPEETEAVASDYRDRGGYEPDFLGSRFSVKLPSVERGANDILDFELDGETHTELRYEHYSVVMNRRRRMCFLSAVNIDGNLSKKSARVAWKWDPRIPKEQQIMKECYGNPPKFSRGHMTRREDPGWGNTKTAKRGNEDSMHVTNTTPQMQAFNAPIWLALEDYALQHAREDEMKISVFTGPYFAERDPEMYGVRIPLTFWKIIAFIHDQTGKLCATGYEMNQEQSLQPEEEFVFGAFTSPQLGIATQVPIRSIEARSGINFGNLASVDPLAGDEEGVADGGIRAPLLALEQIRFVR